MESKPTVTEKEYIAEAWRLSNLEMFIGKNLVHEYLRSVDVQLTLPYPDRWEYLLNE